MAERKIYRGDSYESNDPLWTITLVDGDGAALDLTGCTVRSTYKPEIVPLEDDPDDATAVYKGKLVIDGDGTATTSDGLHLSGSATAGIVEEWMTESDTRSLPSDTPLYSDIEVTDKYGRKHSFVFTDPIVADDAVTNRTT